MGLSPVKTLPRAGDCVLALVVGHSVLGGQGSPALGQAQSESQDARDIEPRFLAGQTVLDAGRPAKAIPTFQNVLAQDPSLIWVLPELARTFFVAEIWQRARSEFFADLSANLPDLVLRNVRRFIRAVDSR